MEVPLADLAHTAVRLESSSDEALRFVAGEIRLVELGIVRSGQAGSGDRIGAILWRRLATEAALRLAWIAGENLEGDASGRLRVDSDEARERIARMRARDIRQLTGAYRAIRDDGSADPNVVAGLDQLAARLSENPAPVSLRELAVNKPQRALYSQHRVCSTLIHPGAAIGDARAFERMVGGLDELTVLATAIATALAGALTVSR